MASTYRGKGGKRGPGARVTSKGSGSFKTAKTPANTWPAKYARRMKAMRGSGVVRDPGPGGGRNSYSVRGKGGARGTTARARVNLGRR